LLVIAKDLGMTVDERPVSVEEIKLAFTDKTITEAFGVGTAAIVAPIATIGMDGIDYLLPAYHDNNLMFQLKRRLDEIRFGKAADIFNWNFVVG
jgi:branched-chain amino acid aminotransferase